MPPPPPRKRFQIHLSTAMVMMFVAGALMWANLVPEHLDTRSFVASLDAKVAAEIFRGPAGNDYLTNRVFLYGWPKKINSYPRQVGIGGGPDNHTYFAEMEEEWSVIAITCNAVVALAILFAAWVLSEYLIRRRAARKGV